MTLLGRVENIRKVWNTLLPHVPPPADMWLAKWCTAFSDEVIESGISRVACKFAGSVDDPERAHKYASATMRTMGQRGIA